jgi:hypothetical protein
VNRFFITALSGPRFYIINLGHFRGAGHPLEYQPAHSPEEFIQIAAGAAHLPRHAIRQKLFASPVMDAPQFARIMEHAYRQMWKHFISSPF